MLCCLGIGLKLAGRRCDERSRSRGSRLGRRLAARTKSDTRNMEEVIERLTM